MGTSQYLRTFMRWWWLIVLCTGVGLAVLGAVDANVPSTYTSTSSVIVSGTARSRTTPSDAYTATLLAQQRMPSYADIARSPALPVKMLQDADLGLNTGDLEQRIEVVQHSGSTVLELIVRDTDRPTAQRLATVAADAMESLIDDQESQKTNGKPLLQARVVASGQTSELSVPGWRNPVVGGVAGFVVGLALAVLVGRRLDVRLHDADSVTAVLGAPSLGTLPVSRHRRHLLHKEKGDPWDEAVRDVRSSLFFQRRPEGECVTLSLYSPQPIAARWRIATSIASVLAETGSRVLLIDADIPTRTATRGSALVSDRGAIPDLPSGSDDGDQGLSDYLSGLREDHQLIRKDVLNGVDVLTAGSPAQDPEDLLYSRAFTTLLEQAEQHYHFVLITGPDATASAGALTVSARVDGTVVLVERSRSKADQLLHVRRQLDRVDARVLGSLLLV